MRISIVMKDGTADFDPNSGMIHFGEAENTIYSGRVCALIDLFDASHIRYVIDKDMIEGLWFKYMCNVSENLTCTLLGIPYGMFLKSEEANNIRLAVAQEVFHVAKAKGISISQEEMDGQIETIRIQPHSNIPSTLQDLEAGRKMELDVFAGKMIEMGKETGVPTPMCWMLLNGIKVLEQKSGNKMHSDRRDI
jgi:2-dehydropantoate 2-reductase